MFRISASQIRAARGLLDWTQDQMAEKAKVSRATVQTIESGDQEDGTGKKSIRASKLKAIYKTLVDHGVEFLDGDGVRRRPEELLDFMDEESCDRFFEHVHNVIREKGGSLICSINHESILTKITGSSKRNNLERLEQLQKITEVKCIISDDIIAPFSAPSFPLKVLRDEPTSSPVSMSTFVYGDELAMAYQHETTLLPVYVVFKKLSFNRNYQNYFHPRWLAALPFLTVPLEPKERVFAYA